MPVIPYPRVDRALHQINRHEVERPAGPWVVQRSGRWVIDDPMPLDVVPRPMNVDWKHVYDVLASAFQPHTGGRLPRPRKPSDG